MKKRLTPRSMVVAASSLVVLIVLASVLSWTALFPVVQDTPLALPEQLSSTTPSVEHTEAIESGVVASSLPLQLAGFEQASEYQRAETLESWRVLTDESCADYALSVLEALHAQDLELVQAGFMDLSGECWGCVFIGSNGDSLSVTLMPERPFSPRSEANLLTVHILHYLQKESLDEL